MLMVVLQVCMHYFALAVRGLSRRLVRTNGWCLLVSGGRLDDAAAAGGSSSSMLLWGADKGEKGVVKQSSAAEGGNSRRKARDEGDGEDPIEGTPEVCKLPHSQLARRQMSCPVETVFCEAVFRRALGASWQVQACCC